jgi:DNA repair exonuclease SbcCD ATPase subunit
MSTLQNTRAAVEREIDALQKELASQYATTGEQALADQCVPSAEPFPGYLTDEQTLAERIAALIARKERAKEVLERVSELEAQKRASETEHKELLKELDPLFAPIGEEAFAIYRDNPLVDDAYAEIFGPLVEQSESIKQNERDVAQLEKEELDRPFLERVVSRGKLALAKNRLSVRKGQMQRLYARAGKQVASTEFISTIGAPSLDSVAAPYLDRMDAITRIEDDLRAVGDELDQLNAEFDRICDGLRAKGCVKDLEQLIEETMRHRGDLLTTIGEAIYGFPGETSFSKQVTEAIEAIRVTQNQIEEKQTFVARIDAALQVERLEDEISSVERSVERKKNQIEEIQAAIAKLQHDQKELESQKREQEATRGDLATLMPQGE